VVHGIAEPMHGRVAKLIEDLAIELDLLSLDAKRHLLAELPRHVAHETRKAVEHLPHRRHPRLDDFVLQVGGETRDVDRDVVDLRILAQPACRQLVQTATLSDELADQVHEGVEAPQIDADVTAASRSPSSPPSPSPPAPRPPLRPPPPSPLPP